MASLFQLDPTSVYLMDDIDSLVLFPMENGRFRADQVVSGGTYEVYRKRVQPPEFSSPTFTHHSPYGAYTGPSFKSGGLPLPHPPRSKNVKIKKTIEMVSLSKKGKVKKGKHDYTTVTQIAVSLTPVECNVDDVTEKVSEQVQVRSILLDSKCFHYSGMTQHQELSFGKAREKSWLHQLHFGRSCLGV